jgi:hypothetical protein
MTSLFLTFFGYRGGSYQICKICKQLLVSNKGSVSALSRLSREYPPFDARETCCKSDSHCSNSKICNVHLFSQRNVYNHHSLCFIVCIVRTCVDHHWSSHLRRGFLCSSSFRGLNMFLTLRCYCGAAGCIAHFQPLLLE